MLFTFSYKPLGKVQKRLVEAEDLELAQAVAAEYCQRKNLQLIPQSVEPAVVADESILSKEQIQAIHKTRADRKRAADKEAAAVKKSLQDTAA